MVSESAVRRSGYTFCGVALLLAVIGLALFLSVVATGGDATTVAIVLIVSIVVAGILAGFGVFRIVEADAVANDQLAKAAGLDGLDRWVAQFRDFSAIVPEENRGCNPEVAAATVRTTMRARRQDDKLFSRIANTLLTPTDAAQLFGPLLDDFVYVFAQSVENLDDQHANEILALVRDGEVSSETVIAYLGRTHSVTVAVRMLRDGVPLEYAEAVL